MNFKINWKHILAISSLLVGFLISFVFVDLKFSIIYFLIWFDRVLISYTRFLWEFGIETYTVPIAFTGILYGPVWGFLVGFLLLPVMDVIRYIIVPPMQQVIWPPIIPSPDSFVDGVPGIVTGLLHTFLSLTPLIFIATTLKIIGVIMKDKIYDIPPKPSYIINIFYNLFLANILGFVIVL